MHISKIWINWKDFIIFINIRDTQIRFGLVGGKPYILKTWILE